MEIYHARPLIPADNILGEGGHWSIEDQALYWVDVIGKRIERYRPSDGSRTSWTTPAMPTAIRAARTGFLVTLFDGVYSFDPENASFRRLVAPEPHKPANRCNDSNVGPDGRYWFGTMQNNIGPDGEPIDVVSSDGALYSFDEDGTLKRHLRDIGISNTVVWSPAADRFYFADSLVSTIRHYPFDVATGRLGEGKAFAPLGAEFGVPDGSCTDAQGYLWNARWDGGCVIRFSPAGEVVAKVELPARRPTSVVFGGPNLSTLFITSARDGLDPRPDLSDGALFAVELTIHGLAPNRFGVAQADR